eukprot:14312986-Alexandrium_andersonii.AAC.1
MQSRPKRGEGEACRCMLLSQGRGLPTESCKKKGASRGGSAGLSPRRFYCWMRSCGAHRCRPAREEPQAHKGGSRANQPTRT